MDQPGMDHHKQHDHALDMLERSTRGLSVSKSSEVSVFTASRQRVRIGWLTTSQPPHQPVYSGIAASVDSRRHIQGSSGRIRSRHIAKTNGTGVNHGRPVVKVKVKRRLTRAVDGVYRRLFASQAHRALHHTPLATATKRTEEILGQGGRVAGMSRTRRPVQTEEMTEDGRTVVKCFWPCVRIGNRVLKVRGRAIRRSASPQLTPP
jgi:hypothetical protein